MTKVKESISLILKEPSGEVVELELDYRHYQAVLGVLEGQFLNQSPKVSESFRKSQFSLNFIGKLGCI